VHYIVDAAAVALKVLEHSPVLDVQREYIAARIAHEQLSLALVQSKSGQVRLTQFSIDVSQLPVDGVPNLNAILVQSHKLQHRLVVKQAQARLFVD